MTEEKWTDFSSKLVNPSIPDVEDITAEELQGKKSLVHLVDVRTKEEFDGELHHIPGSEMITLDQLANQIDLLPKDKTIVFVCRSGQRSARATAIAHQHGFSSAYNLLGGMIRWNKLAFETE